MSGGGSGGGDESPIERGAGTVARFGRATPPGFNKATSRWSWTWTFILHGRRRRMTFTLPSLAGLRSFAVMLVESLTVLDARRRRNSLFLRILLDMGYVAWPAATAWILCTWITSF